jgi:hypothetical protein
MSNLPGQRLSGTLFELVQIKMSEPAVIGRIGLLYNSPNDIYGNSS